MLIPTSRHTNMMNLFYHAPSSAFLTVHSLSLVFWTFTTVCSGMVKSLVLPMSSLQKYGLFKSYSRDVFLIKINKNAYRLRSAYISPLHLHVRFLQSFRGSFTKWISIQEMSSSRAIGQKAKMSSVSLSQMSSLVSRMKI